MVWNIFVISDHNNVCYRLKIFEKETENSGWKSKAGEASMFSEVSYMKQKLKSLLTDYFKYYTYIVYCLYSKQNNMSH